MTKKHQRKPLMPQVWQTCDEPTRLLRWSRHVANARKYLLLCCAVVRNWPGGVRTELGREVLQTIEQEARTRPLRNVRLNEDVLLVRFPDAFQPGEVARSRTLTAAGKRQLGNDARWVWLFAQANLWVRQTTKAVPNLLIPQFVLAANQAVAQECRAELNAIRKEAQSPPLGNVPFRNAIVEGRIVEAIVARLPEPVPGGASAFAQLWQAESEFSQQRWRRRNAQTTALVCGLIREVFGDPTSPWRARPEWLEAHGGVVRRLAEHAEQTGDFGELPILGDALEDAGCSDAAALRHCRGGGPHALGCWVVDALLKHAKEAQGDDAQAGA